MPFLPPVIDNNPEAMLPDFSITKGQFKGDLFTIRKYRTTVSPTIVRPKFKEWGMIANSAEKAW